MASNASSAPTRPSAPVASEPSALNVPVSPDHDVSSSLAPSQPWRDEFKRVNGLLGALSDSMKDSAATNRGAPVLRVTQLDAVIMDLELFEMLKAQFFKSFAFFRPDFKDRWQPELEMLLKVLLFEISIGRRNFTYGQQLQNLTFRPLSRAKKLLFVFLTAVVPYLMTRWFPIHQLWVKFIKREEPDDSPDPVLLRRIHSLEKLYQVLSVLNFLAFLWNGAYVGVVHRMLGMKQEYLRPQTARFVGFEYMNRQMIWNGFTEFMLFIMPMVPTKRIARTAKWIANSALSLVRLTPPTPTESLQKNGSVCPICTHSINIPYETNCGHRFCYYCIKVATLSEEKPPCAVCSSYVTSIKRYHPTT